MTTHGAEAPSSWIVRFLPSPQDGRTPDGPVLDLACGAGRHVRIALKTARTIVAVDRDIGGLAELAENPCVEIIQTDLEGPQDPFSAPGPLAGRHFACVIVTNYLHRPLFAGLNRALSDGGLLLYETFGQGNAAFGKPSNPDFLLAPGELLAAFAGLDVIAYECGLTTAPDERIVQRLAARKSAPGHPAGRDRLSNHSAAHRTGERLIATGCA